MLEVTRAVRIERDGWRISVAPAADFESSALIECALRAARGALGEPLRRSRHASTYTAELAGVRNRSFQVFVKIFDASRGFKRIKELVRGSRAANTARMAAALGKRGFRTSRLLMVASDRASARSIVVTELAPGRPLSGLAAPLEPRGAGGLRRKRAILGALGAEVARLHRAGFIHGDLTPFNIFVEDGDPPRFIFIDHDRTRRVRLSGRRLRLKNLGQLGRFDFAGLSRADRLRVIAAYAAARGIERRRLVVRLLKLLEARSRRISPARLSEGFAPWPQEPGVASPSGSPAISSPPPRGLG